MDRTEPKPFYSVIIPIIMFIPILGFTVAGASSFGAGLIAAIFCLGIVFLYKDSGRAPFFFLLSLLVCAGLLIHGVLSAFIIGASFNWQRFAIGLVGSAAVSVGAYILSIDIPNQNSGIIRRSVGVCLCIFMFNAGLSLFGIDLELNTTHKPAGIYYEPSHLAIGVSAFLLFSIIKMKYMFYIPILLFFFFWGVLYKSLLMLIVVVFVSIIGVFVKWSDFKWRHVLIVLFFGIAFLPFLDSSYFLPRISFSLEHGNASTWVLIQGWENAIYSLRQSYGVGLGHQQFGLFLADGPANRALADLSSSAQIAHLRDGGSTAPKIIGEFGILGFILTAILLIVSIKAIIKFRSNRYPDGETLLMCFVVTIPIELFARGTGYFTPTILFSIAGYITLFRRCYMKKFMKNDPYL
jgi:hypothetical protein